VGSDSLTSESPLRRGRVAARLCPQLGLTVGVASSTARAGRATHASGRAERRSPLSAAKSLRPFCWRLAPLNGPGAGGVLWVPAVSGRRADLLPRSFGVVGSSCGPLYAFESSGYPPAQRVGP
jgi:hypothetical protein